MIIIKIGGGARIHLAGIIKGLKAINDKCVLVHGANGLRDELAGRIGYNKKVVTSISGYTSVVSERELIDLQMMAYAGLRNKRIVERCQQYQINAVGLCGLDAKLIEGRRNRGIKIVENGKKRIVRDFSGKPKKINEAFLNRLLEMNCLPVLTVPIMDEKGVAINSENDDIVALLQERLKAERVVHFIEAKGFLRDPDDEDSVINQMTVAELSDWERQSSGRIKRKLHAIKKMFDHQLKRVIIADGRSENPLADALSGKGTVIE